MTLGIKSKLVYASFSLAGLLWISSSAAASALHGVAKDDKTRWAPPVINKPVAIAPMPEASLNINVSPVASRTADTSIRKVSGGNRILLARVGALPGNSI